MENATYDAIDATIEEHSAERTADEPALHLAGDIREALDFAFKANRVEEIISRLKTLGQDGVPAVQKWATETHDLLSQRSPTSMKVALRAIRKGAGLSLLEALQMELGIATAFCVSDILNSW
jgi:3-hydroxyisobutyryl-CoA hydrolase